MQRKRDPDALVVEFPDQDGGAAVSRLADLIPPSGRKPPARFIRLALDCKPWDLNVAQVVRLVLIKVALTLDRKVSRFKRSIQTLYNVALKRRAFVSGISDRLILKINAAVLQWAGVAGSA